MMNEYINQINNTFNENENLKNQLENKNQTIHQQNETINKIREDNKKYQTVYAKNPGSAAAPTAGLHFTKEYLEKVKKKGVNVAYVTLHVGLGTFRPVSVSDVTKHDMHSEYYILNKDVADLLNNTRQNGKCNIYFK